MRENKKGIVMDAYGKYHVETRKRILSEVKWFRNIRDLDELVPCYQTQLSSLTNLISSDTISFRTSIKLHKMMYKIPYFIQDMINVLEQSEGDPAYEQKIVAGTVDKATITIWKTFRTKWYHLESTVEDYRICQAILCKLIAIHLRSLEISEVIGTECIDQMEKEEA